MPRDRRRVRCEALDAHALWLAQPSAKGGVLVTYVDFSGRGAREVPIDVAQAAAADQRRGGTPRPTLFGGTPRPAFSGKAEIRVDAGRLIIDGPSEPLGVVVHLPGGDA
jgi:hypothetical protein